MQAEATLNHSCSHLLAAAIKRLYPKVKFAIGPAIENGFYYDFEFSQPVSEADFGKIEKTMGKIKQQACPFERKVVSLAEAKKLFASSPIGRSAYSAVLAGSGMAVAKSALLAAFSRFAKNSTPLRTRLPYFFKASYLC